MGAGPSVQGGNAATVSWGGAVLVDELVDERAAAERKKARKEARAKRRQAERQPAGSSGSFAAQRSAAEIAATRRGKVDLGLESVNVLPLVEGEDRRTQHSNGSADRRHERKRQQKEKRQGKENFPRVSPSPPRKTDRRPHTTPTKDRVKRGSDRSDVQSDWKKASSTRYKDPRMWRLENRPTYSEFKKTRGLENDMSTRRHSSAASTSPQSLLLVGDRALAVTVGKTVAFSEAANETQTFVATGALRRRRSGSHRERPK